MRFGVVLCDWSSWEDCRDRGIRAFVVYLVFWFGDLLLVLGLGGCGCFGVLSCWVSCGF